MYVHQSKRICGWVECECGINLRKHISEDLFLVYRNIASKYNKLSISASNPSDQDLFHEICKSSLHVCTKLRDTTSKNKIMKECKELFYNSSFDPSIC